MEIVMNKFYLQISAFESDKVKLKNKHQGLIDSTTVRLFAEHVANRALIPGIPHGP